MENAHKFPSRRNFIKELVIDAAALSAIPIQVLGGDSATPDPFNKAKPFRLPLRIMMKSELPDPFREKLLGISPEIRLEENDQAIRDVNA